MISFNTSKWKGVFSVTLPTAAACRYWAIRTSQALLTPSIFICQDPQPVPNHLVKISTTDFPRKSSGYASPCSSDGTVWEQAGEPLPFGQLKTPSYL